MSRYHDNYVSKVHRGEADPPPVGRTLGFRMMSLDRENGRLEARYEGNTAFLNPAGHVQGGMLGAMLDDVTGMLVTALIGEDERCATLNLNLSFLRPALPGPVIGRALVVKAGRDIYNVIGELVQNDKMVATATATCMVVRGGR